MGFDFCNPRCELLKLQKRLIRIKVHTCPELEGSFFQTIFRFPTKDFHCALKALGLVCLSERIKYVNWGDGVSWSVFIHQHFSSASRVEIMRKLKRRGCLTEECNCITNARPMPMALSVLKAFKAYENSIIINKPYLLTILNKFIV